MSVFRKNKKQTQEPTHEPALSFSAGPDVVREIGRAGVPLESKELIKDDDVDKTGVHDMNIALSYGVKWDIDKCGRDVWQNFFDQHGGTVDGVSVKTESAGDEYVVTIEGDGTYDYRYLTLLGATTKQTGQHTAGGFGEGAKILALSLLRDHGASSVEYRSADWRVEFYIDDIDESKVAAPTKGLFAKVEKDLEFQGSSTTTIRTSDEATVEGVVNAKRFFRSRENPDFTDTLLHKTLEDGTEIGVRYLGLQDRGAYLSPDLAKGSLYVAGQMRHFSPYGDPPKSWNEVRGMSVWTTKDVAPGDRDRGNITGHTAKNAILAPLAESLSEGEVEHYIRSIEDAYDKMGMSELDELTQLIAKRGKALGMGLEFDKKFVAVNPFEPHSVRERIKKAGYIVCPHYFEQLGMQSSAEVVQQIHEHERVETTPEIEQKITILQKALDIFIVEDAKKKFEQKEVAIYSKEQEKSPAEASHSHEYVWVSEEHMRQGLYMVLTTYFHELDHKYGPDSSAEFSYALTDSLAEIMRVVISNPEVAKKLAALDREWAAIDSEAAATEPKE